MALLITVRSGFEAVVLPLDWDFFRRQSREDALYLPSTSRSSRARKSGAICRQPGAGARRVATHTTRVARRDVLALLRRLVSLQAGLGRDIDFVGLWISYAI
jgi:hypothetical protein